ncbi:hypothetical protein BJ742DRAFT_683709, partial [Cladochytrium replicatum]
WWKSSGLQLEWNLGAVDRVSAYGHVEVIQWWKSSNLKLRCANSAIHSETGIAKDHVEVLDWWKGSGLEMLWTTAAIDGASANGFCDVLNCWKSSGLQLKYPEIAIFSALRTEKIGVPDWWTSNTSFLKLTQSFQFCQSVDHLNSLGVNDMVRWWTRRGYVLPVH